MWYGGNHRHCYRWEQATLVRAYLNKSPCEFDSLFEKVRKDFPEGLTLENMIISAERFTGMCIYLHLNPVDSLERNWEPE